MRKTEFRCNKYSPGVLYMMVIVGVATGLLLFYGFLVVSGINKGPYDGPIYFQEHPRHAIYLIFSLIPIAMGLPAWIAKKYWSSKEEEGQLELYDEYAVLYWKNKEFKIEKGELQIKIPEPQAIWYSTYLLQFPGHRIVLVNSLKEGKEKRRGACSLDIAISELSPYKKLKKRKQKDRAVFNFHGIRIVFGITTPAVFEDSPYYVDYQNIVTIPNAPFVTCMVRERANPVHVVADVQTDIKLLQDDSLEEKHLSRQAILRMVELDKQIEID